MSHSSRRVRSTLLALAGRVASASLFPALLAAQSPSTGFVAGRVTIRADSALVAPATGAVVSVVGSDQLVTTGADGRFVLGPAPAGERTLRVRLLGYRTVDRAIRVRAGDTSVVDVVLFARAQVLEAMRADARTVTTICSDQSPASGPSRWAPRRWLAFPTSASRMWCVSFSCCQVSLRATSSTPVSTCVAVKPTRT